MKSRFFFVFLFAYMLMWVSLQLSAQDGAAGRQEGVGASEDSEATIVEDTVLLDKSYTIGLIFNTSNILLDLDGYQSGVGIKLRGEASSLRGLFSVNYESSSDELETMVGITYERPFFTGRVSPYWGISGKVGLNLDEEEQGTDDWTKTMGITAHLGAVLGAEVYLFEFLSVFAEYNLGGSLSRIKVTQSSSGTETENTSTNFRLGTELGNEASLGVVIYLEKRPFEVDELEAE